MNSAKAEQIENERGEGGIFSSSEQCSNERVWKASLVQGEGGGYSQTNLRLLFNTLNPQHSYSKPTLPFAGKVTGKMYLFVACFISYFSSVSQFSSCLFIHAT